MLDIYFVLNISPCDCANRTVGALIRSLLLSQTRTRSDGVPADRQTAETVERWTDSKSSKKAEVDSYKFVILNNCASDRVSGGRRRRAFRNRLIEIEREACSLEPAII